MQSRLYGLDVFRLLAAFFVIVLHLEYPMFAAEAASTIRLLGRWAVPFFFLLTGYFLGRNDDAERCRQPLAKAVFLFCLASLIMLPLDFGLMSLAVPASNPFTEKFLFHGTHFHLWYLSSLVTGLLVLYVLDQFNLRVLLPAIAVASILAHIICAGYLPIGSPGLPVITRHFSSIGMIYLGMLVQRRQIEVSQSLLLIAGGFLLQGVEIMALVKFAGKSAYDISITAGTVLFAVGLLGASARIRASNVAQKLGGLGAAYGLGIYIIHPYFTTLMKGLMRKFHLEQSLIFGFAQVPFVFFASLFSLIVLGRLFPIALRLLAAERDAVQQCFYGRKGTRGAVAR